MSPPKTPALIVCSHHPQAVPEIGMDPSVPAKAFA